MGLMALVWVYSPMLALLSFLLYSAWHFGEADGKKWHFSPSFSLLWGSSVLLYILGTHAAETTAILSSMKVIVSIPSLPLWALLPWAIWGIINKQFGFILTLIWLSLSSALPLLFSFGLYFIGQHSIHGWKHIQMHLNWSHQKIWLQALPFHAGAWFLLGLFYWLWPSAGIAQDSSPWGLFFIFIACISFPHVIAMHGMYRRNT
jgi:Brp/Blh family beta-carotene 15,15'-monooxygenase